MAEIAPVDPPDDWWPEEDHGPQPCCHCAGIGWVPLYNNPPFMCDVCNVCGGSGRAPGPCLACRGSGQLLAYGGAPFIYEDCEWCDGRGAAW